MTGSGRDRRRAAEQRGRQAETRATALLVAKGYDLLASRVRTPAGEIDLIVSRANVVAFVEVKSRRSADEAIASVTPRQARRIVAAAHHWLGDNPAYAEHDCRFDIVLVTPYQLPHHLANAFGDGLW